MSIKKSDMAPPSSTENGVLTKIFRGIAIKSGYISFLKTDIDRYVNAGGKKSRATIKKTITDEGMTWKNFLFLLLELMRFKKMKITVEMEHEAKDRNGKPLTTVYEYETEKY